MPDDARRSNAGGLTGLVRLGIMLLLGGVVALPFVGQSGSRSGGADSRAGVSGSSASGEKGRKADAHTDALMLLGEFVGLDVTDGALDERKARMVEAGVELTRRAFPRANPAPPAAAPGEPFDDYTNVDAREWQAFSREKLRFELVQRALARRHITPEFLIATVPDPINSNANWTFDPVVSAISSAAAASGFLMDRFYIPDWSPEPDGASDSPRPTPRHEKWPGVVLFRNAGYKESDKRVLVTSLVFETPTSGIHQEAFVEAVRIAAMWFTTPATVSASTPGTIRVLGPTFSGSIVSLRNAIDAFPGLTFRIVTGSATNRRNESIREAPNVTFKSTVQPDDEVEDKLVDYLASTSYGTDRIALLVEEDTSYGNEFVQKEVSPKDPVPQAPAGTLKGWPESTRVLPFPLQISRLRSAATAQSRPDSTNNATTRLLGLSLGQSGAPTDQLPSLTPITTSSAVELQLSQIVDVIKREHITTVGLLATDTRDKLFLAQQLTRRSATVRLFTIESDLYYVHPDYSRYVNGMIVASSYPLFAQNQRWVDTVFLNRQFPTTMAQGVFNAMVILLRYDPKGNLVDAQPGTQPILRGYRQPGTKVLEPPIWIGVAGNDAIWPVAWYPSTSSQTYVHPVLGPAPDIDQGDLTAYVSAWVMFGVAALGVTALLHVVLYVLRRGAAKWNVDGWSFFEWPFFRFFGKTGFTRRQPYLFVALTVLCVAWGYTCALMALTILRLAPSRVGIWPDTVGACLSALLLVALMVCASDLAMQIGGGAKARFVGKPWWRIIVGEPQYSLMLVALVCAGVAGGFGAYYLASVLWHKNQTVYYFVRATHPGNGVSPATPLMLIVAVIYLWAFVNLRRLSAVSGESIQSALCPLEKLVGPALKDPTTALRDFIDGAVQKLPHGLTATVVATALIAGFLAVLHPLSSPEHFSFAIAFRAAWILVQILLWLGFAHVAYFWYLLRQAMHAFAGTPMIGAFGRLSPALFHDRLSPRQPDDADMRRMMNTARQLGLALDKIQAPVFAELRHFPGLRQAFKTLEPGATEARPDSSGTAEETKPDTAKKTKNELRSVLWAKSAEWTALGAVVPHIVAAVDDSWKTRPRPTALSTIDIDAVVKSDKDYENDLERWVMRAEEFLAMHVLLVVRELLGRLVNVFFYVIVAVMLLVSIQQAFPFEPRQELLGMTWVYVLSAVILVMTIVVQMEHDEVLSAFASTTSGTLNWDAALWSKIFIYGVIPVASVFAAQFPGIGTTLLEWLTPVQKALP